MDYFGAHNKGTSEDKNDTATKLISEGTQIVGEILRSHIGPKGALKILQGRNLEVTNDGAHILKNLDIQSASAKILINSSISQDEAEGDGTTTIAVLTSLILKEAYNLSIKPVKIIQGLRKASSKIVEVLDKKKFVPKTNELLNLVKTTLSSKVLANNLDLFAKICVDAMDKTSDIELVEIIKLEGEFHQSFVSEGFILNRDIIVDKKNPKILVANTSMDADKVKIFSSSINVNSIMDLENIELAEKDKMKRKVDNITSIPFDIFINRQLIYDYPSQLFRKKNVVAIEHADFVGVERLNKILGGSLVSTFDDLKETDFGTCESVSNINVGNKRMIKFDGIKNGAATIVLFGSSKEILDEAERSIHDALCVLKRIKDTCFCLYGGGSSEMMLATELSRLATETKTKDADAIEAFSRALQQIPKILAENCGFDGDEFKTNLRNDHSYKRSTFGLNVDTGKTSCMRERGIIEGYEMKKRVFTAASETAQMILKCDAIVRCPPRERHKC